MDLSDLRIFRAVVDEGGITKAAAKLHRVQSNVTTRVRNLEEDLGVKLFLREGKRLRLSSAGQVMVDYADRLLSLAEEARDAVKDQTPRGVFRLGAMESTAAIRLPELLSIYQQRYPAVTFELATGNPIRLGSLILSGEIDAALAAEPIPDEPFEKRHAFDEPLVLIAPANQPAIGADGPLPESAIAFEAGCPHRALLQKWYRERGQMPTRLIESGSYHAILGCVVAGMGVALMPKSVLATFPERDRVSVHDLPSGFEELETVLMWRKGAISPNVRAMAEIIGEISPTA